MNSANRHRQSFSSIPPICRGWLVVFGFIAALITGVTIGTGSPPLLIALVLGVSLVGYLVIGRHFTWQFALLLCFLDFYFEPFGFRLADPELCCLLGFGLVAVQIWQKRQDTIHPFFRSNAFRFFQTALSIWLAYAIIRFVWNYLNPPNPEEYAFANAVKSEFSVSAVLLLMWLFSFRPLDIPVKRGFATICSLLLLIGLCVNITIRLYGIKQGILSEDANQFVTGDLGWGGLGEPISAIFVPVLRMTENPASLRFNGPIAVLFGMTFLTSPHIERPIPLPKRLMYYALAIGGLFGAAISGGRASLLFAAGVCILILVVRRKFAALTAAGKLALAGFALLNIFSEQIVNDPKLAVVQRSFYWALMDRANWAQNSIDDSTRWRQELFHRAIDEWKSNPATFWFGRGTYKYSDQDRIAIEENGYQGTMDVTLRRGATHNLISDLLIAYGLVGLILYFLVCIALIRLCWSFATNRTLSKDVIDIGIIAGLCVTFTVIYGVTAGELFLTGYNGWLIAIILARIARSSSPLLSEASPVRQIHTKDSARPSFRFAGYPIAMLGALVLFGQTGTARAVQAQASKRSYFISASGALGDGSGSSARNAADASTPEKYYAINQAQSVPGTTIFYAPGTYFVNTVFEMHNGVTHQGSGINSTIIKVLDYSISNAREPLWLANSPQISGFRFFDATIDFNTIRQPWWEAKQGSTMAFAFSRADHCVLERLKFIHIAAANAEAFVILFGTDNSALGNLSDNVVDSCIFTEPVKSGNVNGGLTCILMLEPKPGVKLDDTNIVSNCTFIDLKNPEYSDLRYSQCVTVPVARNNFARGVDAFWFIEPGSQDNYNALFQGLTAQVTANTLVDCGPIARILMHPGGSFAGNLLVANNIVAMTENAYAVLGPRAPQGVTVEQYEPGDPEVGAITISDNTFIAPLPRRRSPTAIQAKFESGSRAYFHIAALTVLNNRLQHFPRDGYEFQITTDLDRNPHYTNTGTIFSSH
jgi:O-Antigen ligase